MCDLFVYFILVTSANTFSSSTMCVPGRRRKLFDSLIFKFSVVPIVMCIFYFLSIVLSSLGLFNSDSDGSLSPEAFPSMLLDAPVSDMVLSPAFASFPSIFLGTPMAATSFRFIKGLPFSDFGLGRPSGTFSLVTMATCPCSTLSTAITLRGPDLSLWGTFSALQFYQVLSVFTISVVSDTASWLPSRSI